MRQIATELGRPLLIQVDLSFVDRFRKLRAEQGKAPKTIHTETTILRQVVNHSRRRNLLSRDPLAGLRLAKPKPRPQPCWTRDEVQRILAACRPPHRHALELLAETGMRVGELKHLTWADIAADGPHPVVHVRPKDGWKPKTGDIRAIPLSPRAVELLGSLPRHSKWVFTAKPRRSDPQGQRQISERRLLLHLKRLLGRIGLPGHLHTFRHAFISHAASEGVPEAVIRSWVGHVSAEIIRLYMHIADRASQGWMQRLHGQDGGNGKPKPPAKPSDSPKRKGKQDGKSGG
jgi:integrase